MSKNIYIIIFTLFFSACSMNSLTPVTPSKKAFELEDNYIFYAIRAEEVHQYKAAADSFSTLYEKSKKTEYLYRELKNRLMTKEYEYVIAKVDSIKSDDLQLVRFKILSLIGLSRYEEAQKLTENLAKDSNAINDHLLLSDIYLQRAQVRKAVDYLQTVYESNFNEYILDKLSLITYNNLNEKERAIEKLEAHTKIVGCTKVICTRLMLFYSQSNNLDALLATYLRYYEVSREDEIGKKIVGIYEYKQEYLPMMSFLEKYKNDDKRLLQLYASTKNYKKAYPLAMSLYKRDGEFEYLAQSAIYEYESNQENRDEKLLKSVVKKLTTVIKAEPNALYLNYLGYLLIDHKLDVKKGMIYVEKALVLAPNSAFYLDSLAWGYYRLGECKRAKKLMQTVVKLEGGDDKEVLSHIKFINKCINK